MPQYPDFSQPQPFTQPLSTEEKAAINAGARFALDTPTSFEQAWKNLQNANQTSASIISATAPDLQVLIEQAKVKLASGATKAADQENLPTVEAVDKATVKQLHALANEAKTARDEAAAQYEAIKQVLKDMLGEEETAAEVLTVNGAAVATWKKSTSVILNQKQIKQQFPREQYPELYTEQSKRTFLLK
jgi:hypothetical protein